jgi:hypothetical protein
VQAASGIAMIESADGDEPGALPCQLLDHGTGYLAAAAAIDGLRRQAAEGGTRVRRLSLARTARWLTEPRPRPRPRRRSTPSARLVRPTIPRSHRAHRGRPSNRTLVLLPGSQRSKLSTARWSRWRLRARSVVERCVGRAGSRDTAETVRNGDGGRAPSIEPCLGRRASGVEERLRSQRRQFGQGGPARSCRVRQRPVGRPRRSQ